jgi:putative endonuclease
MKINGGNIYCVYITTNKNKTVLYTGITNNLRRRLAEHEQSAIPFKSNNFAGQYDAYFLIYYETFTNVKTAIAREKEIKGWRRSKKEDLIKTMNAEWIFLNDEI